MAEQASTKFAADLSFLEQHGEVVVLEAPHGGVVAVSPKYQGRVMTSAVGRDGASLGYINRDFIQAGKTGTQFDNYGGEDRFWLGPEGGQYGLYFPPGAPFDFDQWQTPAGFQEGAWKVVQQKGDSIVMTQSMKVRNHSGTELALEVTRTVRLMDESAVLARLGKGVTALTGLEWVAFETDNVIKNVGSTPWTKSEGLVSIWILAMYNPTPDTWVVVPFDAEQDGPIVNDEYFGKVPAERLRVDGRGYLRFKCDGLHRSKIGLGPKRALEHAGSYSPSAKLLTVVHYDKPPDATDYVNSMWEKQAAPYGGDVINSYNDGPVEPGGEALGGFYEIETSSPAAALKPGESMRHVHRTMHFTGPADGLEPLSQAAFGVTLTEIAGGSR